MLSDFQTAVVCIQSRLTGRGTSRLTRVRLLEFGAEFHSETNTMQAGWLKLDGKRHRIHGLAVTTGVVSPSEARP